MYYITCVLYLCLYTSFQKLKEQEHYKKKVHSVADSAGTEGSRWLLHLSETPFKKKKNHLLFPHNYKFLCL